MKEIVIKIPEYTWVAIQNGEYCGILDDGMYYAIKNGTVLPEHHGRLIDANELSKDDEITLWVSRNPVRTGKELKRFSELFLKKIDETPTILEATEGKE